MLATSPETMTRRLSGYPELTGADYLLGAFACGSFTCERSEVLTRCYRDG